MAKQSEAEDEVFVRLEPSSKSWFLPRPVHCFSALHSGGDRTRSRQTVCESMAVSIIGFPLARSCSQSKNFGPLNVAFGHSCPANSRQFSISTWRRLRFDEVWWCFRRWDGHSRSLLSPLAPAKANEIVAERMRTATCSPQRSRQFGFVHATSKSGTKAD